MGFNAPSRGCFRECNLSGLIFHKHEVLYYMLLCKKPPEQIKDWAGHQKGILEVKGYSRLERRKSNKHHPNQHLWACRCGCGKEMEVSSGKLRGGAKSCGCLRGRNKINFAGQKIGRLEVIKFLRVYPYDTWLCKCECGNTVEKFGHTLRTFECGRSADASCGCWKKEVRKEKGEKLKGERLAREAKEKENKKAKKITDILKANEQFIGLESGKLTVESLKSDTGRSVRCVARCRCGKARETELIRIKNGIYKFCGDDDCPFRFEPANKVYVNQYYRQYMSGAKSRGYDFELSAFRFYRMTQRDCFYCGHPPWERNLKRSKPSYRNEKVYFNGIDRFDNNLGYVKGNCVPCCFRCNQAKNNMSAEDFKNWAHRLVDNLGKRDLKAGI